MDRLRGTSRYHWWIFVVVIALAAGTSGVVGYRFATGAKRIDRVETALTALCLLRVDLDQRIIAQGKSIANGFRFLHQHPEGAFGFTAAQIRTSIRDQQRTQTNSRRTRAALRLLKCKETNATRRDRIHGGSPGTP